jgi:hypothetical protein
MTAPAPPPRRPALSGDPRNLLAAGLAAAGAALVAIGAFADWYTISIAGVTAPGGTATGWEGRDGRTVVAGAAIVAVAAALVALDSRRLAPRLSMVVVGFITTVIAVAGIVDTTGKAAQVEREFAIPAGRVSAQVGAGLWLVALGALLELAGGIAAHQAGGAPSVSRRPWTPRRRSGGSAAAAAR